MCVCVPEGEGERERERKRGREGKRWSEGGGEREIGHLGGVDDLEARLRAAPHQPRPEVEHAVLLDEDVAKDLVGVRRRLPAHCRLFDLIWFVCLGLVGLGFGVWNLGCGV